MTVRKVGRHSKICLLDKTVNTYQQKPGSLDKMLPYI